MIATAEVRRARPTSPEAREPGTPRFLDERERLADGRTVRSRTVFPIGAECPFACVYCDLWTHTTGARPTPPGSIPRQLRAALAPSEPPIEQVKVYNASNFFEQRAVPAEDDEALLEILAPYPRVVVECHPRWIGERCFRFAGRLPGRLQVAIGLETAHPEALPRLGKAMTVERFDRAVEALLAREVGVRAFVLVGAPFVPSEESEEWAVRSVEHALRRGVEHVALLPVRGGNGTLEALERAGEWRPPSLAEVESAFDRCLDFPFAGVVTVDTWDLDPDLSCPACFAPRRDRLERTSRTGRREAPIVCPEGCGKS